MKKIISILVLFLFFLYAIGQTAVQKSKNDCIETNLKGKVKLTRETKYSAFEKNGEVQKRERMKDSIICFFNEKGNIVESISYYPNGNIMSKDSIKYNNNDNRIEVTHYYYGGNMIRESISRYDDNGKIMEENIVDTVISPRRNKADTIRVLRMKYIYKYDVNGKITEKNFYGNSGSLHGKDTWQYDANGNMIEENYSYCPSASHFTEETKKYANGHMIEEDWHSSYSAQSEEHGEYNYKHVYYKYGKRGTLMEEISYTRLEQDSLSNKYICKYDNHRNILEKSWYNKEGLLTAKYVYKHNDNGNLIGVYDVSGNEIEGGYLGEDELYYEPESVYKFGCDKNGNWIKSIEYKNDMPISVTERVIEYF